MIAHAIDVSATAGIGLGRELTAVGIKRHAKNIGHHDPLVGVDIAIPHPGGELLRVSARDEREIAEHHQTFDVVRIGAVVDAI